MKRKLLIAGIIFLLLAGLVVILQHRADKKRAPIRLQPRQNAVSPSPSPKAVQRLNVRKAQVRQPVVKESLITQDEPQEPEPVPHPTPEQKVWFALDVTPGGFIVPPGLFVVAVDIGDLPCGAEFRHLPCQLKTPGMTLRVNRCLKRQRCPECSRSVLTTLVPDLICKEDRLRLAGK